MYLVNDYIVKNTSRPDLFRDSVVEYHLETFAYCCKSFAVGCSRLLFRLLI